MFVFGERDILGYPSTNLSQQVRDLTNLNHYMVSSAEANSSGRHFEISGINHFVLHYSNHSQVDSKLWILLVLLV